jgi:plastocyanin
MHARRPARTLLAATLAAGLLLAACGDDDDDMTDAAAGDAVTTTTEAPAEDQPTVTGVAAGGGADAAPGTLEVEGVDYAFQGLPESVPAGTKLTFTNSSTVELHELVAMRIPDEETRSLEELLTLPEPELMGIFGGPPATVLLAPPAGEQISAVGDGTLTEPGRYALVCFIPTGADPAAYLAAAGPDGPPENVAGGPPHIVHGMHAELVVE